MGEDNAVREIIKLTNKTLILKETFRVGNEFAVKEKLVNLYPDRLTWVSTHISGSNKHSQFIYEIVAQTARSSSLNFTAHHMEYQTRLNSDEILALTNSLCKYDSDIWKLLAKAMERELSR